MKTRVRFAPSPTGFLHIGSVRTALFNWLYARHTGGTFVLRIEDTDVARNTEQSLRTILDGLRWLGLDWDEGPEKGGPLGPYFQSQRADIYKRRVKELIDKGIAYEREGAIRFKMTRQPIEIPDLIVGGVVRPLNETEMLDPDFVIVRSDGNPVFHLVNVVDDIEMQITHVIRGEDHLSNTPKHIALFRAFGVEPPKYAHIPMILNADGTKMSKSDPDAAKARLASLQTYIDDGLRPRGGAQLSLPARLVAERQPRGHAHRGSHPRVRPAANSADQRPVRRLQAHVDEWRVHPRAAARPLHRTGAPVLG